MTSSSWRDEIELEQENTLCRHGARESFWSLRNIYQTPPGVKLWRIASRRVTAGRHAGVERLSLCGEELISASVQEESAACSV